jgi:hypothetical protein
MLALPTHLTARNLSPCSPLLPCNQVSPCALTAFLWKHLHSHKLACNQVSPCALVIEYHLLLLLRPSGDACTFTGSCRDCLVLLRHPLGNACTLTRTNRQPSSHPCQGHHHCWSAIVVRQPSSSGCHRCWAAIVALLPRATSELPICCWATLPP